MPILVGLESISHEWPGKQVFKDQTIGINEGDIIGIVGKNGDGKSTLLQLIGKTITPDSGKVTYRGGLEVGMLSQTDSLKPHDTVQMSLFGTLPEYEWASDPNIRQILTHLIGDIDLTSTIESLSGGQRKRVDLCRLLVKDFDILLLDEPTNHLDIQAITWLAEYLKQRAQKTSSALLVVTHDRWFLDTVCNFMWEVHDGKIDPFEGGYSAYIQQRAERARLASVHEARRQSILRKELAWLARGPQARTSKPKFRIEEAKALIADVPPVRNELELKAMAMSRLGKQVVEMKDVSFSFPDKPIISHLDWLVGPGDRWGIVGQNGAGKSTLLKLIQQKIQPSSGTIKIGKSVKLGILSQHLDVLQEKADWRVNELLTRCKSYYHLEGKQVTPKQLLERLGFDAGEYESVIGTLSGGQKRRLAIMYVLLQEPNVLILDEPGNDLDTDMLAVLEDLLDSWPGTLFLVSHDRYLMERVCDDIYALEGGSLRHLPRGIDEYLERLALQTSIVKNVLTSDSTKSTKQATVETLSNKERREYKKKFDSTELKLSKLRTKLTNLQEELNTLDQSDFVALTAHTQKISETENEINELEELWLELADLLDIE